MSAVGIRCHCGRCAGGVTYARVSDYLGAHRLDVSDYVLESEVELDENVERSRVRHPSYVGRFEDGSEILVETHARGAMTAATRPNRRAVWGPPTPLDVAP